MNPEIHKSARTNCEEVAGGSTRTLHLQDKRPSMVMFNIFEENTEYPRQTRPRPSIFSVFSQLAGGSQRPSIFSRFSDLSFDSFTNYHCHWNYRNLVLAALICFTVFILYIVLILLYFPDTMSFLYTK